MVEWPRRQGKRGSRNLRRGLGQQCLSGGVERGLRADVAHRAGSRFRSAVVIVCRRGGEPEPWVDRGLGDGDAVHEPERQRRDHQRSGGPHAGARCREEVPPLEPVRPGHLSACWHAQHLLERAG